MSHPICFTLNGAPAEANCRADMTVLEWLRGEALLRGTKEGCAEGDCGACSVLVKRPGDAHGDGAGPYQPANSCIMLMGQMEGASLLTVEGLAAMDGGDGHAVQNAMAENGSSQCGFCTPGIVVAVAGLLERETDPDDAAIHDALAGNLCRCTGYRPIVEAARTAAETIRENGGQKTSKKGEREGETISHLGKRADLSTITGAGTDKSRAFLPSNLAELHTIRTENPDATLLAGGTDLALDIAHARARWDTIILTRHVAELRGIEQSETHLTFGGAVTWEEALPQVERHWPSFATLVRRFGSVQIRSMGTIAGNLATASPIGDGAPALVALGASLTLSGPDGEREVALDDFFTGYRKSALKAGEVIRTIHVPLPTEGQAFRVYKISKRYDQDISTVCGAFALEMDGEIVSQVRVAFGGMAAVPMRCVAAEEALVGNALDGPTTEAAKRAIRETFDPMTDMRGSADYRALAAANLVQRLALDVAGETVEVMAL